MPDRPELVNAFVKMRATWDDLIVLEPEIVRASGPLTASEIELLQQRAGAHDAAVRAFAEAVRKQRR